MKHLATSVDPEVQAQKDFQTQIRLASRAIVLNKQNEILALYTDRFDDYSLPGGGLRDGEDPIVGMVRELQEETGAYNVRNIQPLGIYEEFRPKGTESGQVEHVVSYCYACKVADQLKEPTPENYEIQNGSHPVWLDIHQAIAHNERALMDPSHHGENLERETFLLRLAAKELLI
ncbi:NUDIX hydrolase [Vibrio gazogenes]|uniref:NUDIX domain-containing protein n=1 Tax=Vibrio gazogenes DSM 21264 = NBRC 103151 TaxID=1123492 RepID=A0A1M5C7M4_VIBGA|nr:NUDIX domain-containing protein [Vibrio gazogenes]USP16305.1 NUDIX domain-containing protein [Vibrio gazogenes]SHF50749.1 NUDIX domain-containing protein [Vibrio gazogenes DSM 21264] [Vibrio gazogenes DSM 21264 = NBRC 103151]